jgi:competence protein ComEA
MIFLLLFVSIAQDLPDGPGKEAVLKICRDCHELEVITADNRTKDGWQKTIVKMQERGAEGTPEQYEAVVAYLTKHYGRINVNKAPAEEIADGLALSPKDAAAIVAYREKNGSYKTWQDLAKVDGLDASKIEAQKDHIALK